MSDALEQLRDALPPIIESLPALKKKTANELAGPCPWCGGDDRFVVFLDTGRFLCRGCTPRGGDLIDFHLRQEGTDIKGLTAKYLDRPDAPKGPKTETAPLYRRERRAGLSQDHQEL